MYISQETPEQTSARLMQVIAQADLKLLEGTYAFIEVPIRDFTPLDFNPAALAIVRDETVWSQLVPSADPQQELFTVLSFHFASDLDNSGFVGWLASRLKERLGTGVFVVCGQNSGKGGIFDYWGCPASLGEQVVAEVRNLMQQGKSLFCGTHQH